MESLPHPNYPVVWTYMCKTNKREDLLKGQVSRCDRKWLHLLFWEKADQALSSCKHERRGSPAEVSSLATPQTRWPCDMASQEGWCHGGLNAVCDV